MEERESLAEEKSLLLRDGTERPIVQIPDPFRAHSALVHHLKKEEECWCHFCFFSLLSLTHHSLPWSRFYLWPQTSLLRDL